MSRGRFFLVIAVLTIIAGLTAVSVWDVYNIIYDYIYENRLTLAKVVQYGDSEFPYISYLKISYSTDHEETPLFMDRFSLTLEEYKNISTMSLLRQHYEWPRNISNQEAEVYKAFFDLKVYYDIRDRDEDGRIAPYYSIPDESELNRLTDQYISHPNAMFLANQAWTKLQPLLLQYNTWADYSDIELDMSENSIDLTIPNNRAAFRKNSSTAYAFAVLDSVYVDPKNSGEFASPPATNSSLWINQDNMGNLATNMDDVDMKLDRSPETYMMISLFRTSNVWVSSRQNFPPCDDVIGSDEKSCENIIWMATISDVCECTPLTVALKEAFRNLDRNFTNDRPLCRNSEYEKCKEDSMIEFQKRISHADSTGACSPCVTYKNSYEKTQALTTLTRMAEDISAVIQANFGESWRPRLMIAFEDPNKYYLYFEEKTQLSMAQLISQVGGDLGLYTGFSMLTVLELFLLLWRFCISNRAEKRETSSGEKKFSGLRRAFTRLTQAILGIDNEVSTNSVQESPDHQLKVQQISETILEKILTLLEERDQKWERQLDQAVKEMQLQLEKVIEIQLDLQYVKERVQNLETRPVQTSKYMTEIQQKLEDEVDEAMKEWREEICSWKPSTNRTGAFVSKARRRSYEDF